jgi:alkylation response protein AidB-like acyl-CoA dehydrogenase
MDFGLSEDQVLFKDTIKRFLADQCPTPRVRAIMESDNGHDPELWRGLANLGVTGMIVAEEHGGLGRELLDLCLVAEELGYAATPGPFLGTAMASVALAASGDKAQQKKWLPRLASGEAVATIAVGEDGAEWDPQRFKAKVEGRRVSGNKPFVPYAQVADLIVVAARGGDAPGLWLVDRGAAGVHCNPLQVNDMTRRVDAVSFRDVAAVELENGAAALARMMDAGLLLVAADAFGGARRCLEMTCTYALQREQFGQLIGSFQGVKHQLAEMATDLEPSLSLLWYAAHAYDHIRDESARNAAMVKAHMTDVYDRVTRTSTELHGGIGFTWEFDLHLWFRRAIFDRGFLGDAAYHRERVAQLAGW